MTTAKEILTKAADFIEEDHTRWTKGRNAKDANGNDVRFNDPTAVCFCSYGLIQKFGPDAVTETHQRAVAALQHSIKDYYLAAWNDDRERTVYEVIRAFRQAASTL